jgi:hypothetical protein
MLLHDVCFSTCQFFARVEGRELNKAQQRFFGLEAETFAEIDIDVTLYYAFQGEPPVVDTIMISHGDKHLNVYRNDDLYFEVVKLVVQDWYDKRPTFECP